MNLESQSHEIVIRDGKPVAVILGIEEYQEKLEKLEDLEGLKSLERLRQEPLEFRRLDEFLEGPFMTAPRQVTP